MASENQNTKKQSAEKELMREKSNQKKRRWQKPEIIEEDYRNTGDQPEMPFSPSSVS